MQRFAGKVCRENIVCVKTDNVFKQNQFAFVFCLFSFSFNTKCVSFFRNIKCFFKNIVFYINEYFNF